MLTSVLEAEAEAEAEAAEAALFGWKRKRKRKRFLKIEWKRKRKRKQFQKKNLEAGAIFKKDWVEAKAEAIFFHCGS